MFSNMELAIKTKYHSSLWVEIFIHLQDFQKLTFWEFFLRKLAEDVLEKKKIREYIGKEEDDKGSRKTEENGNENAQDDC